MDATDLGMVESAHDNLFAAAQQLAEAIYGGLRDEVAGLDDAGVSDFGDELLDDGAPSR